MSAWDEKAYEHAEGRSGEYFGALPEQLFEWGARWQREALLADDVIERVADVLERMDGMDLENQARAALTAALGIEGDE